LSAHAGGYITVKFLTNPVPPSSTYDTRLEAGLLRPIAASDEEEANKEAIRQAHREHPDRNPPLQEVIEYEFYLADTAESGKNFKRKFDVFDPDNEDDGLYTGKNDSGAGCFRFKRIRAYESASAIGSVEHKYDDELLIAAHDGSDGLHQKAAYYYPLVQKVAIRPQRSKNINKQKMGYSQDVEEGTTDFVDMRVEEPDEEMVSQRNIFREFPWGPPDEDEEEPEADADSARKSATPPPKDADATANSDHSDD